MQNSLKGIRLGGRIGIGVAHHRFILHDQSVREFLKINLTPVVSAGVIGVEVIPK